MTADLPARLLTEPAETPPWSRPMTDTPSTSTPDLQAITRLSVNINHDTTTKLHWYMEHKDTSATEAVRRAVDLLELVERETAKGNEILLRDQDGNTVRQLWTL